MAQKKTNEVDSWLARPDAGVSVVLLYGPDRGLVAERAAAFARNTGLPLDDPFSVVKLDAAEIDRGEGRLLDEARTVPMFSDRRLLWIRNAGAQKTLANDVKSLIAAPAADAVVLIEAGELKKGAPLRTAVEAGSGAMALPCYADEDRSIEAVIDDELAKAGMTMALDARQALRRNLGGDRLASRAEIQKLALYAHGKAEITLDDVRMMTGDVSGQSFDDAVDAAIEGRIDTFDTVFTRQCQAGSHPFQALGSAMRLLQSLHSMRGIMDGGGGNAASVVGAHRPPIFYARRKLVERALQRWSAAALNRGLARLQAAVLETRRRPDLAVAVARQALLGIAVEGARLGRNADSRR
ncbi:DNA polymerase III subunit delta [Manganibacter manganicus]|uniref:DNA polymerase III subunit delta n=1 Tax=Manganibacter manganicus TaxID=1873176 RepID=A0A1V8RLB7_9HYPH|nr:DNA polymerase III subunit delta [Pseudaminobacter manganicus]OQM73992.1 DNA polymerase III subunit delta [Pseudaminobacter manganicus]